MKPAEKYYLIYTDFVCNLKSLKFFRDDVTKEDIHKIFDFVVGRNIMYIDESYFNDDILNGISNNVFLYLDYFQKFLNNRFKFRNTYLNLEIDFLHTESSGLHYFI